jgi:hypothetical protein
MCAAVRMGGSQSSCRHRQATESGCGSESHERFMKHVSLQKCLQQKYVVRILTTHHCHEGLHGPGTRSRVVETWCAHSWGFVSLPDKIRSFGRLGAGGAGNRSSSGFRREAGSRRAIFRIAVEACLFYFGQFFCRAIIAANRVLLQQTSAILETKTSIRLAGIWAASTRPLDRHRSPVSSQIGVAPISELFLPLASDRGPEPTDIFPVPRSLGTARKILVADFWWLAPEFRKSTPDS